MTQSECSRQALSIFIVTLQKQKEKSCIKGVLEQKALEDEGSVLTVSFQMPKEVIKPLTAIKIQTKVLFCFGLVFVLFFKGLTSIPSFIVLTPVLPRNLYAEHSSLCKAACKYRT